MVLWSMGFSFRREPFYFLWNCWEKWGIPRVISTRDSLLFRICASSINGSFLFSFSLFQESVMVLWSMRFSFRRESIILFPVELLGEMGDPPVSFLPGIPFYSEWDFPALSFTTKHSKKCKRDETKFTHYMFVELTYYTCIVGPKVWCYIFKKRKK